MSENQIEQLKAIVEQELGTGELYLVDVELKGDERNRIVWIYIESVEGGVSVDRCAQLNRAIGEVIDTQNLFKGKYRLNVSSPGTDKPLVDIRQYYTNKGRKCSVRYAVDEQESTVEGTLKQIEDHYVIIDGGKQEYRIPFQDIVETRILAVL